MCVKINVKVGTSSVKYGVLPLNILLILLKMRINNDHFFRLHIFKYHNLVFRLFISTGHILVKTVPSSLDCVDSTERAPLHEPYGYALKKREKVNRTLHLHKR